MLFCIAECGSLTSGAVAGVAVLVPLSADAAVLARARVAGDVLALAVVPGVAFVASATAKSDFMLRSDC